MSAEQAVAVTGYPLTAVVYPVPAPHPHHHNNPINPRPPSHQPRAALILLTLTAVISLLFFLATMLVIVWLIVHPNPPKLRVDSLLVSGFNATSSQISGSWTAHLTVFNPNAKMQAFYEALQGTVYYNDELLAQNRLPPFHQGTLSVTSMSTTMVASAEDVDDWVVPAVDSDRCRGCVRFGVRITALVHFRCRGWKTRRSLVKINCGDLAVAMPANATGGMLFGGDHNCNVYL